MNTRMGLPMAIIIGINAMVGAGIFTVPSALQANVGPAGLIAYIFVIIAVIFMALSLARVSELYPEEGSFYVYTRSWAGHIGGIFASTLYVAGLTVAMGLLTKITGNYVHIYFPKLSPEIWGALIVGGLVILNIAGAVISQIGQIVLFALTLLPLALITILCLTHASLSNLTPFAPYGFGHTFNALKAVVFGFFGFEAIPSLFALVDNPQRTVPRAIIYSISIVGLLYFVFVSSIFLALPRELFTSSDIPLAQVLLQVFPEYPALVHLINWAIIITIIGTLHAMIWAVSSLLVSLSKKISSTSFSLTSAVIGLGTAIIACSFIFTSIDLLFSIAGLCIIGSYMCAMISLIVVPYRRTRQQIIIASIGLFTAAVILLCALDGVIHFTH